MAGFPYVNQVADAAAKKSLQAAFDQINGLTKRIAELEASALKGTQVVDVKGQRITNLGPPQAGSDAASVDYVREFVQALTEARIGGMTGTVDTTTTPSIQVDRGLVTGAT